MLRRIVQSASLFAVLGGLGVVGQGCLDRPVVPAQPQTKTNFSGVVAQNSVDQLDILFDIDNSASMGDKQALLELAIPDLINRLVNPNCVDANGNFLAASTMGANGTLTCGTGSLEFNPVHDMHLGIVSSSLGTRGGDLCNANQVTNQGAMGVGQPFADGMPSISSHTDDQGHLLGRSAMSTLAGGTFPSNAETETNSPVVGGQNFIDWFPLANGGPNDPAPTNGPQALMPVATVETSSMTLETDFANLVAGVHAFGCGIESQLESWYRFLIQPDPYASIAPAYLPNGMGVGSPAPGSWVGYDQVIIQQRHDFLRPKSLVAIIVLSDENDSEIDTRSFGGQAYRFMVSGSIAGSADGTATIPAFDPPKGTSTCATNPGAPACTSCAYCQGGSPAAVCSDPNCAAGNNTYTSPVDWGNDANLRHVHMKAKYGIAPQYPIERYYLGLTSSKVPDRTMEYPSGFQFYQGGTAQPNAAGVYQPGDTAQLNCTNPLFAPANADGSTTLPNGSVMTPEVLCNTAHPANPLTSRGAGLVFFAHIGGVPHQLLQATPGEMDATSGATLCPMGTPAADCPQKDTLAAADWVKILGTGDSVAGPETGPSYDYSGIDPHMIESDQPRTANLPTGSGPALVASAPQPMGGGADPINGREWVTDTSYMDTTGAIQAAHYNLPVDREYACIFPLVDPTSGDAQPRDCSDTTNFVNQEACDCSPPTSGFTGTFGTGANSEVPAVCGSCSSGTCAVAPAAGASGYNLQYYAKTYPTIRETELVHLMGGQGILSSLCPIHTSYMGGMNDPVFGYRPAVTSIINRLKTALTAACLPEQLLPAAGSCTDTKGNPVTGGTCVPCLILATLPATATSCTDPKFPGFFDLSPQAQEALKNQQASEGDAGTSGAPRTCQVYQIPYMVNQACKDSTTPGWCYVQGSAAGQGCTQAIQFSGTTLPSGSEVSLQCLEQSVTVTDGGS